MVGGLKLTIIITTVNVLILLRILAGTEQIEALDRNHRFRALGVRGAVLPVFKFREPVTPIKLPLRT